MTTTDTTVPAARTAVRSAVLLAGRVLPVHHPLESFIAVNPLGGLEAQAFPEALRRAGDWYGARGTLPEREFRAAYRAGRVTDADLTAVLVQRYPGLPSALPVHLGDREITVLELLRHDMLAGPPAPAPVRRHRTRSEQFAPSVAEAVDTYTTRWCASFLRGEASWAMPGRDRGFYPAWRELAFRDRTLPGDARTILRDLPEHAEDALTAALDRLGVDAAERAGYLRADLTRMPGWAAHVRWQGDHGGGIDLVDYLAMRLTYESVLLGPVTAGVETPDAVEEPSPRRRARAVAAALGAAATEEQLTAAARVLSDHSAIPRPVLWLEAYERHYRDDLLRRLSRDRRAPSAGRPAAQVVCCIDVRSEGLRRRLEALGAYDTYGFAGFFAVAISLRDLDGALLSALCPALVEPGHLVTERPAPAAATAAERQRRGTRTLAAARDAFHAAKDDHVSPFALAEAAGWAAGPLAAARTAVPATTAGLRHRLHRWIAPPAPTVLDTTGAMTLEQRLLYAQAILGTIGLTRRFARLVVLCAHGSTTENNPYQAALDCGACGGHRGGPNARTAAALLNDPDVRAGLATRGIVIPRDSWFVAAEHDTTTDRVTILDPHLIPLGHRDDVERLSRDLERAGEHLAAERSLALPGASRRVARSGRRALRHVRGRAGDWAQVYPEWGLAGNAAFVVGPRSLTHGLDLHRRVFLHSYDAEVDADGTALETILTAPLVVAQWINAQYYFSSVDPEVFGAGTKTVHNAIGGAGVLSGQDGDLRLGLPWQSVADGETLVHEPMRLLAVVQAPLERIATIVDRNPVLRRLTGNDWITLTARAHPDQPWQRHGPHGWQPWIPGAALEQETTR
jgi:hypothetical protein